MKSEQTARRVAFVMLALASCTKAAPAPAGPVDSGVVLAGSSSAAAPSVPPPPVPAVKPQCKGNALALDTVFSDFACLGSNIGAPELRVVLTASPTEVAPGGKVEITATFTNDADAPVAWGMTILPGWDLFPLTTKNVSAIYPCERGPSSNTPAPMVIVLDAHGSGHVKRTWVASRSMGACGPGVPLEPGTYEVGVGSTFANVRPASVRVVR